MWGSVCGSGKNSRIRSKMFSQHTQLRFDGLSSYQDNVSTIMKSIGCYLSFINCLPFSFGLRSACPNKFKNDNGIWGTSGVKKRKTHPSKLHMPLLLQRLLYKFLIVALCCYGISKLFPLSKIRSVNRQNAFYHALCGLLGILPSRCVTN